MTTNQHTPLLLFALLLSLGSCKSAHSNTDSRTTSLIVLEALFDDGDTSVIDKHYDPQLIEHNPSLDNGTEALRAFVETLDSATTSHTVHRLAAWGDLVAVQSHVTTSPEDPGMAAMDIFRFENDLIVEHWDVVQAVPVDTTSGHTMFDGGGSNVAGATATGSEEANIELVGKLYEQVFNAANLDLLDELVAEDYVQHSPDFADGRAGLRGGLEFFQGMFPDLHIEPIRFIAEGDLVFAHVHITFEAADLGNLNAGNAGVDIFRIKDGLLVEHWDSLQEVVAETASGNSMF